MGVIFPNEHGDKAGHDGVTVNRLVAFEILAVVLQLLSIVFNGAIICTLCKRSLLKYPSNRFVFSLCLSHLVVSFLSVSISLVTTLLSTSPSHLYLSSFKSDHHHGLDVNHPDPQQRLELLSNSGTDYSKELSGPVQCTGSNGGVDLAHLIMMHLNFGVAVCTSITVALISAERYITIARPMRYKSIVTARRSLYAIICCWLLAALTTMMPLLLFENRSPVCGTFSVPMESLATYFGIVFAVVALFALAVMIVCYTHIFRIAKAKCQKVQIGHFTTSTVSSISSDWPSSAYSTVQGQHRFLHAGSRIESSNSLLHWVLMTNLGKHAQPLRIPSALRGGVPVTPPATPTLPPKNAFFSESALNSRRESDETTTTGASGSSRNGSTSSSGSSHHRGGPQNPSNYFIDPSHSPLNQYHHLAHHRKLRNRWKTYLQPNYNSPRKTIFTIVLLIGAVLFTQLPLSFVLFTTTVEATQRWFLFCTTVLFATSSVANPVLYGFLNRSIRDQLWRLLRRKSRAGNENGPSASSIRRRKRGQQQQLDEMAQNAKGFLSTANHRHLQTICRGSAMEIPAIKISRKESISSDDNSSVHSVASTNSVNIIGTGNTLTINGGTSAAGGVKGKITQVQKRVATSSPYYRSVLLKKAYANSSNSLLPRLALPDVNVRRNSSGSIISISPNINGVMSKKKGKVKEIDGKRSSSSNKYELVDDGNTTASKQHDPIDLNEVEMQTFRNYSTPDLTTNPELEQSNNTLLKENDFTDNAADIEISVRNATKGQAHVLGEEHEEKESRLGMDERRSSLCVNDKLMNNSSTSPPTSESPSASQLNSQPGSSQTVITENKSNENNSCSDSNLRTEVGACLSSSAGAALENAVGGAIDGDNMLPDNFPRKPSQDSGADMAFSDEEDELPPPASGMTNNSIHLMHHHPTSPLLVSAASLHSLPTVLMTLKSGEDNDIKTSTTSASCMSLVGPLVFIGHPDITGSFRGATTNSGEARDLTDPIRVPLCSCTSTSTESDNTGGASRVENGVTVTITDSNSDTQLFNPELFNSDRSLLQMNNDMRSRGYFVLHHVQHHPLCTRRAHKSKSESDICTANERRRSSQYDKVDDTDLKIRSNCHINLAVDPNSKTNVSSDNNSDNADICSNNEAFTLCCDDCCGSQNKGGQKGGASSSCCSLWVSNGRLPLLATSYSSEQVGQQLFLKPCHSHNGRLPSGITSPSSLSPQWLSVMSVHSSCSSLSSTCPLRILEGHSKSADISDYDDFEDHIET